MAKTEKLVEPAAYQSQYSDQMGQLYNDYTNRKFSYNVNQDALYNQYRNQYQQQGRMAMRDTMGQAAALTGGYGSSYGQAVGQQQYNAYLQNLNDVVPELYNQAYSRYQDQGNSMLQQYNMLQNQEQQDYSRYQDAYSQYWNKVQRQDSLDADARSTAQSQVNNLLAIGQMPSDALLNQAGISKGYAKKMVQYYEDQNKPAKASTVGSATRTPGTVTNADILQHYGEMLQSGDTTGANKFINEAVNSSDNSLTNKDVSNYLSTNKITINSKSKNTSAGYYESGYY